MFIGGGCWSWTGSAARHAWTFDGYYRWVLHKHKTSYVKLRMYFMAFVWRCMKLVMLWEFPPGLQKLHPCRWWKLNRFRGIWVCRDQDITSRVIVGDVSYSTEGGGKSKNLYCIHGLDHEVWLQKQVVFFVLQRWLQYGFYVGFAWWEFLAGLHKFHWWRLSKLNRFACRSRLPPLLRTFRPRAAQKKSRIFWFRWLSLPPSQVMFLYNIYTHHIYIYPSLRFPSRHTYNIYIYVCMYKVYLFILYIDLYSIYFTYVLLTIYIYDSGFISYIYIYIVYIYIYYRFIYFCFLLHIYIYLYILSYYVYLVYIYIYIIYGWFINYIHICIIPICLIIYYILLYMYFLYIKYILYYILVLLYHLHLISNVFTLYIMYVFM